MRILHIPHAYFPVVGGAETICQKVSEQLVDKGHTVEILTSDVTSVQAYYSFNFGRVRPKKQVLNGVPILRLPFCDYLYRVGSLLNSESTENSYRRRVAGRIMRILRDRLTFQICRQIKLRRPDVVMTMPHLVVNVEAVLKAKLELDFPLVMVPMLHEHDPNWDINIMAASLELADGIVAMTSFEIERLVDSYNVPRNKVFLGSVGVDSDPSVDTRRPNPRIIFLGRMARSKGLDCLLDAMDIVWESSPEASLCLAGVATPEYREIKDRIRALPVEKRNLIVDVGTVHGKEKKSLLQSARCLVLPSKTESFGMVLLDAWSQGTPVVTWDLPLFRSIVDDGVDGILANPGSAMDLARAIQVCIDNPEYSERMGANGWQKVDRNYSWEEVANGYFQAYTSVTTKLLFS